MTTRSASAFGTLALATLAFVTVVAGCRSASHAANSTPASFEAPIRAVLEQQVRDWNDGHIDRFMLGYARSEATRFASGGEVQRGWETVLARYQNRYTNRAAMGRLTFTDLEITPAGHDTALVFGRWRLDRQQDTPTGLFTLFFRQTPDGWRILHDHTSSAP